MSLTLSPGQSTVFDQAMKWYDESDAQEFVLAGYAGTGKSTLADSLNEAAGGSAHFCAFTGKAANVLREKGCDATTLHRALYKPVDDEEVDGIEAEIEEAQKQNRFGDIDVLVQKLAAAKERRSGPSFVLNWESTLRDAFVIVDEYSMLSQELIDDLRKMARKILYLGDPEQLPPVNGTCGLEPDAFLTEIHRQALDSPIIRYATAVREGRQLDYIDEPGFLYQPKRLIPASCYAMAEQIIVGRNDTRRAWNNRFRKLRGIAPGALPQPAEKLICLKNNSDEDLFNGMILWAGQSHPNGPHQYVLEAEDGAGSKWRALPVWLGDIDGRDEPFNYRRQRHLNRFDFAYTITCHKSQGSEFEDVLVYDEPIGKTAYECRRWRYTALTRARKKVVLVDPS